MEPSVVEAALCLQIDHLIPALASLHGDVVTHEGRAARKGDKFFEKCRYFANIVPWKTRIFYRDSDLKLIPF